jgi:putative ATP-dependent endonuclease of OLD family
MELVAFSVQNFRSITKTNRIDVGGLTVLVGPNNEGKSNVVRALITAMQILKTGSRPVTVKGARVLLPFSLRHIHGRPYDWEEDFPVHLQNTLDGVSTFLLEFELDEAEIEEFRQHVQSSLNGTLPIKLTVGRNDVVFTVPKKGPGGHKLSQKASAIALFIAERIEFEHIEAVRTAESAENVVRSLIEKELAAIEQIPEYQAALRKVRELQEPVLNALSASVHKTMVSFLPAIKSVRFEITEEQRIRALRRSAKIIVDDGTPTDLERKGDGVQSLAALALMRHASEIGAKGKSFVIAIEEPESHLHPSAMHVLRRVIAELSAKYQVVITTHSPLFVDRNNISSNILVNKNKAVPAKSVDQIRSILGVRASDNLRHAELVVVVEGEEDKTALTALIRENSSQLAAALDTGKLAFETLAGGSNLSYVLGLLRDALLCSFHCFLDNDETGRKSFEKAKSEGLVDIADVNLSAVSGMVDSELEDLYELNFYKDLIWNQYKVALDSNPKFKSNKRKWSDRVGEVFKVSGKPWNEGIKMAVKAKISALVASDPKSALNEHKVSVIDNFVKAVEEKLTLLSSE